MGNIVVEIGIKILNIILYVKEVKRMKYIVKPEVEFKEGYCHSGGGCGVNCSRNG